MARIFISHSSHDDTEADRLLNWLSEQGWHDVFLDRDSKRGLQPGDRWQDELRRECNVCEVAIFLISPSWLASKWCLAEYLFTKQLGKLCIPVIVAPVDWSQLPVELTAEHQITDLHSSADGWLRLKIGLEQAGATLDSFTLPPERRPYPGLAALNENDPALFFGRDAQILAAVDSLRLMAETRTRKLAVILGASGAGKSSLLRAGIWPRLARDSRNFLPLRTIRPTNHPLTGDQGLWSSLEHAFSEESIGLALSAEVPRTRGAISNAVKSGRCSLEFLLDSLTEAAARAALCENSPPMIVLPIDQGEELFQDEAPVEAEEFLSTIGRILRHVPNLLGIIAIRSDSYPRLQEERRIPGELHAPFNLEPMSLGGFKEVIEGPAKLVDLQIEPALTDALLRDAKGPDALPLLAFTLERLHRTYGADGNLKLKEYQQMGGVAGAISVVVNEALRDPPNPLPRDRASLDQLVRKLFIPHLVRVDENRNFVRRVALRSELPTSAQPLVGLFVEHRLLTSDRRGISATEESKKKQGVETVEIAHEALLREWPALVNWLLEEREFLTFRAQLQRAHADYESAGKRERRELLLRGLHLRRARAFLRSRPGAFTSAENDYIASSAARRVRQKASIGALFSVAIFFGSNFVYREFRESISISDRDRCDLLAAEIGSEAFVPGVELDLIDHTKAIPVCESALDGNPGHLRILHNLARAYESSGDYTKAVRYYREAADQNFAWSQANLAVLTIYGKGTGMSLPDGIALFRISFEQGNSTAKVGYTQTDYLIVFQKVADLREKLIAALRRSGVLEVTKDAYSDKVLSSAVARFNKEADIEGVGLTLRAVDQLGVFLDPAQLVVRKKTKL